jgi:hypothetical protein
MKKGMVFDLYMGGEDGPSISIRVVAINDTDVMSLEDGTIIKNIDFENDVVEVLIDDIYNYPF